MCCCRDPRRCHDTECYSKHLEAISAKLTEIGCEVIEFDDAVRVVGKPVQRHTDIKTLPYPGFLRICSRRWQSLFPWQMGQVW